MPRGLKAATRPLLVLAAIFFAMSWGVGIAQEGVGGPAPAPGADDAPSSTGGPVVGTAKNVTIETADGQKLIDEEITITLSSNDQDGMVYTFTNHGGTLKRAITQHERYTREPLSALQGVPANKLAGGQIDLVSTWSPKFLPYRLVFQELGYPDTVKRFITRVSGASVADSRLIPPDSAPAAKPVKAGDELTISAPSSVAATYTVKAVTYGGLIETDPPLKAPTASAVAYEVVRMGELRAVFEADPTYTRISETPGLPLVYVWPDPKTDESPVFIEKRYSQGAHAYELDLVVTLHNLGDKTLRTQAGLRVGGWQHPESGQASMFSRPTDLFAASCYTNESLEREEFFSLRGEQLPTFTTTTDWVGVDTTYFLLAAVANKRSGAGQCNLFASPVGVVQSTWWTNSIVQLQGTRKGCAPGWLAKLADGQLSCTAALGTLGLDKGATRKQIDQSWSAKRNESGADRTAVDAAHDSLKERRRAIYRFKLFNGPKDITFLKKTSLELGESLDLGIFGFISKPLHMLLIWLQGFLGSWALAIVLLTIGIKLVLLPLTNKSFGAMQKMQKLKPKIDELKKKYGSDRQELNKETIALYKREKVNPLGGCLPMLLQMPIWFGLYQTIYSSIELYHSPLGFWINDLSAPDPLYIMPILLGLLMFVQTFLTTSTATIDGLQGKILKFGMPIMFSVFMLFLPSGLVLYILVNTCLTIVQNVVIRRRMGIGAKPAQPAKSTA